MISHEAFLGGTRIAATMSADIELASGSKRVQVLTPQFAGLVVYLPDAQTLRLGWPQFVIMNLSGSYTLDVKDASAGAVVTVPSGDAAILGLAAQADAAGSWSSKLMDIA